MWAWKATCRTTFPLNNSQKRFPGARITLHSGVKHVPADFIWEMSAQEQRNASHSGKKG